MLTGCPAWKEDLLSLDGVYTRKWAVLHLLQSLCWAGVWAGVWAGLGLSSAWQRVGCPHSLRVKSNQCSGPPLSSPEPSYCLMAPSPLNSLEIPRPSGLPPLGTSLSLLVLAQLPVLEWGLSLAAAPGSFWVSCLTER